MDLPADLSLAQVKKYLDRRVVELDTLFKSLAVEDPAPLREILHRWKGNAELYGFRELGILAGNVVRLLDISPVQWPEATAAVDLLAREIKSEVQELSVRLSRELGKE